MTALAPSAFAAARARRSGMAVSLGLCAVFVAGVLASATLAPTVQLLVIGVLLLVLLVVPAAHAVRTGADLSGFLLLPTILSATQNLYLLLVVDELTQTALQPILVLNFVDAVVLLLVLWLGRSKATRSTDPANRLVRRVTLLLALLCAYGAVTVVLFHAQPMAAFAALRNLVTPMLFLLLGLLAARTTRVRTYQSALVVLGVATVLFGFLETSLPDFWQRAGIGPLWKAKGIGIAGSTALPENFYSSEQFDGSYVRRMVSSFADPVNYGTFLFAVFMGAVALRQRVVAVLVSVAAVYAVSKGYFLSTLVFVAVWAQVHTPKPVRVLSVVVVAVVGVGFYLYTLDNSSGSTSAHVGGFTAALVELPSHPLGRGVGNVGILARVLGADDVSDVQESAIGVVIAQLGVPGIVLFGAFFTSVIRAAARLADPRRRVVALSLVIGFLANAMFNEVAMSPNSGAPFFVMLGLLLGRPDDAEDSTRASRVIYNKSHTDPIAGSRSPKGS